MPWRFPSGTKAGRQLPILNPLVEFLPKRLEIVYDRSSVGWRQHVACRPTSVVWSDQGEPLRGTDEYWRLRFRHKDQQPVMPERVKVPDWSPGWNVLPIMSPPCGYVEFLS